MLCERRKKLKLSQEELARKSGVSRASIARYETNEQSPTLATAQRLAETLGCTIDDLFGNEKSAG